MSTGVIRAPNVPCSKKNIWRETNAHISHSYYDHQLAGSLLRGRRAESSRRRLRGGLRSILSGGAPRQWEPVSLPFPKPTICCCDTTRLTSGPGLREGRIDNGKHVGPTVERRFPSVPLRLTKKTANHHSWGCAEDVGGEYVANFGRSRSRRRSRGCLGRTGFAQGEGEPWHPHSILHELQR